MHLLDIVGENPWLATAAAAVMAALAPLFKAMRRALIRRIDRAWPDDAGDEMTHEDKVRHTVGAMNLTLIPDSVIERTVRSHKE